ncbi:3-oxoacyl-ACP reductase [Streptomyces canus]|uniref:3-oxoacyl-ACP reductase n=1 Tax=Streptomyces canus TaxID=58343 RepID=A0A101RL52_9ACTN|nr:SDR family oxidoreductase [Streptomyces canus]KUN57413.1 3-oxoacyl-ACP reductase [Streptomyces canus]
MATRSYSAGQAPRSIAGAALLITGAGSGIGAAAARLFASEGAWVAVTDQDAAAAEAVASGIAAQDGRGRAWRLDVADGTEIERVVGEAATEFDGLDCLINNAGFAPQAAIGDAGYEDVWQRALDVMLTAVPRTVRAALPWLLRSPFPRILNVASTEACAATAGLTPYAAAKAGVTGLTRALAVELGPEGVTCNCLLPGPVETGLTAGIPDQHKQAFARRRTALRRYGRPEEIAHIMLDLCLPSASYLTGATVPVDGGLLIRNG